MNPTNSPESLVNAIKELKSSLGSRIVIPAHHYQKAEIVGLSDFVGDSYKLAKDGAASSAEYIVFCGVRFMAESAAILARPGQTVLIPDPVAGCPMADMIDAAKAAGILERLDRSVGRSLVPLTYMNSYADMKALTGRRGGAICTSSNAKLLLKHFLDAGQPVFFAPDYNLGINTARQLGLPDEQLFKVGKDGQLTSLANGALVADGDPALTKGRLFLWDGYCHVHKRFKVEDVAAARQKYPGCHVVVHPESDEAVVQAADSSGSTEAIFKTIAAGRPGSTFLVGTEASFVLRMAGEMPDRTIVPLRESYCFNMARISLGNLLASLQSVQAHVADAGSPLLHVIGVDEAVRADAARALKTMIAIVEGAKTGGGKP